MASKFIVQVCNLSNKATEKDVRDFFGYCGTVLNVRLESAGKFAKVAFVTFKEPYALETAVLLSGSSIIDQEVCVVPWGGSEDAVTHWKRQSMSITVEDEIRIEREFEKWDSSSKPYTNMMVVQREPEEDEPEVSNPAFVGRAVTMAQDVVTTMVSKGYTVSKNALIKAKELDGKYQFTANAAAKVASLGNNAWTKAKELEEKYNVRASAAAKVTSLGKDALSKAKELEPVAKAKVASLGERNADGTSLRAVDTVKSSLSSAGSKVVSSPYFCAGAKWVSESLDKASKATSELATKGDPVSKQGVH